MKLKPIICLILLASLSGERDSTLIVEPPAVIPGGYPATLRFTEERYNRYVATWIRYAQTYNKSLVPPPFDSILMTPVHYELTPVALFPGQSDTVTIDEAQARHFTFIDDWQELLSTTSAELTVDTKQDHAVIKEYFYRLHKTFPYGTKVSYSLAGGLNIHITHAGVILFLRNYCLPTVDIPAIIAVDSLKAKRTLTGKQLVYFDWGGRKILTISDRTIQYAEIAAVAVPRWADSLCTRRVAIEYRGAWRIRTGIFDIYVDAITGEDLNYAEQTVIF